MEREKLFEEKTTEAANMQFSSLCMYSEFEFWILNSE